MANSFMRSCVISWRTIWDDTTTVQKLDVPGPDEKFCLCWLCAYTKFSSGGAIFRYISFLNICKFVQFSCGDIFRWSKFVLATQKAI